MLPFLGRSRRPKSARSHRNTVSSQRIDISQSLCSLSVERLVWFLGNPNAMEQDRKLTCHSNYCLAFSLLATSSRQMQSPLSECGVSSMRSQNVVRALDQ
jgi:hypothetical protein